MERRFSSGKNSFAECGIYKRGALECIDPLMATPIKKSTHLIIEGAGAFLKDQKE